MEGDEREENESKSWKFSQKLGEPCTNEISVSDMISAVQFDETGNYIATGDRGGRVVIFERTDKNKDYTYNFYTDFQSHEPEFDYLKSLEVEEKINSICWCKQRNAAHFLITTNDKTVKLWKVFEKAVKTASDTSLEDDEDDEQNKSSPSYIRLPKFKLKETVTTATAKRVYQNAHAYHINSISVNSDGETFISSDDLRINLWNIDVSNQSFNIVDLKPKNMEELTEVITSAVFHPFQCNLFIFSTSKGSIRLNDMRQGALCDTYSKLFGGQENIEDKSFFSEIVSSVSDVKFTPDGRYIVARDYLTLKIWDVNMESSPIKVINIHEHLRPKLYDLYESDHIFDKFACSSSSDGEKFLTATYGNYFHIYDVKKKTNVLICADTNNSSTAYPSFPLDTPPEESLYKDIDYNKRILTNSWHPSEDIVALAAANNLLLYRNI